MPGHNRPNRYANKRKHKIKMKKRYSFGPVYGGHRSNIWLHESECREQHSGQPWARNGGYEYWKAYYLSGERKYAKLCTNRVIRAYYRDQIRKLDQEAMEDIAALRGADYEKMFDYVWTIW